MVMLLIDSMSASSRHLKLIRKYYKDFKVFGLVLSYDKKILMSMVLNQLRIAIIQNMI